MAFLLLLGDLIYRQTTVESYQTRGDRTFVVGNEQFMMSHLRVGQKLQNRFPEIEDWCSVSGYNMSFNVKGQDVYIKLLVTAPNFFEFFDYRLLMGDKHKVLSAPNQMVVSKSFAQRYWPDGDAVGKEVVMGDANDDQSHTTYTISGVMDDFDRSVIPSDYECIINVENLRDLHSSAYDEYMTNAASCVLYLMEREGCDLRSKTTAMRDYLKTFFWPYRMEAVKELTLTPLSTLYYDAKGCSFEGDDLNHGSRDMARLYVVIALLVLVFAIFNYVNLSVSLITERSKEMATRRLLGLSRLQVFAKLIGESIVFTAVAFAVGYLIALVLEDKAIEMANCPMDLLKDTGIVAIVCFLLAVVVTGALAGFVPASILSSYEPIDIVRGTFRRRVRQRWSHGLMVLQAVFAIVMLTVSLLLNSGIRQRMSQPLGYETENILQMWGISGLNHSQRQTFRDRLMQFPEVDAVGYGFGTPVEALENNTCQAEDGTVISIRLLMGDTCFFNILKIHPEKTYTEPKGGNYGTGVNHQLLRQFGRLETDTEFTVSGQERAVHVSELYPDIVYQNVMNEEDHPTPFTIYKVDELVNDMGSYGPPRIVLLKYHGERKKVEETMTAMLKELRGYDPLEIRSLSQMHHQWYEDYKRFLSVLTVFTVVALLIAILGLMAMNSYFVGQRRREIAIRRVFGAEISGITLRLLLTVVIQSVVAMVIAIPLSWWLAPMVGSISGLRIEMQPMPLVFALFIVLAVNVLTAAFQGWRAATENPVNSIKNE